MNIGINGYEAVVPRFGFDENGLPNRVGTGEYAFQILNALHAIDKKNGYFVYFPIVPSVDLPNESLNWKYRVFRARKLWTLTSLSENCLKMKKSWMFSLAQLNICQLILECLVS